MKLFDENERYTEEALHLGSEISRALRPIIKKYIDYGYSIREICHIIAMEALSLECEFILQRDHKRFKERRENERKNSSTEQDREEER